MVFEPLARLWGYPVLQVRFEELPLGGGGAHIGDLNISIFLQGLHDGPQLGTPPKALLTGLGSGLAMECKGHTRVTAGSYTTKS